MAELDTSGVGVRIGDSLDTIECELTNDTDASGEYVEPIVTDCMIEGV